MISIQFHNDEARLASLHALNVLDTPTETEFDQLVHLAAEICGTPISLVSLVDDHRQWFKASVGMDVRETPRDISFCAHAIQQPELFVVENAIEDRRFSDNPLVTGDPSIRFYAGMPLETPSGHKIGTLCVIDTVPRTLRKSQETALKVLASQVQARMDLRLKHRALQMALAEKERVAADLRRSESLFRLFMNNSPFMSYIKDSAGRYLFYNAQMANRFNVSMNEWLGLDDFSIWPEELAKVFREHDLEVLASDRVIEKAEETPGANGETTLWRSFKFPYEDDNGNRLLAGISVDVTEELQRKKELEAANLRLQELAVTDELTGLKNRRAFEERLRTEFTVAKRKERDLSVLMIDLDHFKMRNDRWGHSAGDDALREMGAILMSTMRVTDLAARYGGEEFVVLLPECNSANAVEAAKRIMQRVAATVWSHVPVTISVGVKTMDAETEDAEQLVDAADAALYEAKAAGRDRIHVSGAKR